MLTTRQRRFQKLHWLYSQFKPPGHWQEGCCIYCGGISQSKDHIPPISWLDSLGVSYFKKENLLLVWVPCCFLCNNLLSDKQLFTVKERTDFLLKSYTKRYKRIISLPKWESWELNELSGRLKHNVSKSEIFKLNVINKLIVLSENCQMRQMHDGI